MKSIEDWRREKIDSIMQLLDKTYKPGSGTYVHVKQTLAKLSMNDLSHMYNMILTSK